MINVPDALRWTAYPETACNVGDLCPVSRRVLMLHPLADFFDSIGPQENFRSLTCFAVCCERGPLSVQPASF
jgi:hypothetical protein